LGLFLADHVVVEEGVDLDGRGELVELELGGLGELFLDDLVAQVDALIADVDARARDELLDLLLRLSAERTLQKIGITELRHVSLLLPLAPGPRSRRPPSTCP